MRLSSRQTASTVNGSADERVLGIGTGDTRFVDDDSQEANEKFMRLMTVSAERMVSQDEPPYELGVRLMADLTSLFEADHAGGPTPCGDFSRTASTGHVHTRRGLSELQIEGLMRQAAREWLALSDPADDELTRCFKRWDDWPDSLGEERTVRSDSNEYMRRRCVNPPRAGRPTSKTMATRAGLIS